MLNAPITFDQIKKAHILRLRRSDSIEGFEVVRTSLWAAIQFVTELEKREEAASSGFEQSVHDRSIIAPYIRGGAELFPSSMDQWVDKVLHDADKYGCKEVKLAKYALRTALAVKAGRMDEVSEDALSDGVVPQHGWR